MTRAIGAARMTNAKIAPGTVGKRLGVSLGHVRESADAEPFAQLAACPGCLHGEADEELVGFDVVCEIAATGQAESVVAGVSQLATVDDLPVSAEEGDGFIEYPVVRVGALADFGPGKAFEHS